VGELQPDAAEIERHIAMLEQGVRRFSVIGGLRGSVSQFRQNATVSRSDAPGMTIAARSGVIPEHWPSRAPARQPLLRRNDTSGDRRH
jgi:hypothetical protein